MLRSLVAGAHRGGWRPTLPPGPMPTASTEAWDGGPW